MFVNTLQYDARYTKRHINTSQYDARYTKVTLTHCNMMHGTNNVTLTHCNILHGTHNITLTHRNMMHGAHVTLTHCNILHGTHNIILTHRNMRHGTHNVTLTHCNMMHGTHNFKWKSRTYSDRWYWRFGGTSGFHHCGRKRRRRVSVKRWSHSSKVTVSPHRGLQCKHSKLWEFIVHTGVTMLQNHVCRQPHQHENAMLWGRMAYKMSFNVGVVKVDRPSEKLC